MDLGISGRTAIVCASSRGLGRGCAMSLAKNGVNIVLNGRDEEATMSSAEALALIRIFSSTIMGARLLEIFVNCPARIC